MYDPLDLLSPHEVTDGYFEVLEQLEDRLEGHVLALLLHVVEGSDVELSLVLRLQGVLLEHRSVELELLLDPLHVLRLFVV